jgi:probable HAF family extracellular repeat protein
MYIEKYRMKKTRNLLIFIFLLNVFYFVSDIHAVEYNYTELLPPGRTSATAWDINNNGAVIGYFYDDMGMKKGFIYNSGSYTELLPQDWIETIPRSINDNGNVVGIGMDGEGMQDDQKGFLYSDGAFTVIVPPDFTWAGAQGINNNGNIVGFGDPQESNSSTGFLYSNGTYIQLILPEWFTSQPLRINNNGDVVGKFRDNIATKGFLFSSDNYTELLPPDFSWADAQDINNSRVVVGSGSENGLHKGFIYDYDNDAYTVLSPPGWTGITIYSINEKDEVLGTGRDIDNLIKGFLYKNGEYTTIQVPGALSTRATSINNSGVIVGYFSDGAVTKGFIATPVTIPISIPTDKQSFTYIATSSPIFSNTPSQAKPIGVGSVAMGGNTLSIHIGLNQFSEPVDIYGAYILSNNPNNVHVLNPDGTTFNIFTISEIINALSTETLPEGAFPWKANIMSPINEQLFNISSASVPTGVYIVYLLVTPAGSLSSYYLWITSFVIQ